MARGILELYTQSEGWIQIELGDPADLDFTPIEVYTPNGWAAPNVVDPSDANTPLEVYTQSRGWMGIKRELVRVIDDFESGGLSAYPDTGSTGGRAVVGRAAHSGNYGLEQTNFDIIASTSGLDNYPGPGDTYEFYWQIPSSAYTGDGQQFWHLTAVQQTGTNQDDIQDHYNLEFISESDADDTVRWRINENNNNYVTNDNSTSASDHNAQIPAEEWIRTEVTWVDGSPDELHAESFDAAGNAFHDPIWFTLDEASFGKGGIGWRISGVGSEVVYWDDARILP